MGVGEKWGEMGSHIPRLTFASSFRNQLNPPNVSRLSLATAEKSGNFPNGEKVLEEQRIGAEKRKI